MAEFNHPFITFKSHGGELRIYQELTIIAKLTNVEVLQLISWLLEEF